MITLFIFSIFAFQLQAQEIKRVVTTDSSVIQTSIYGNPSHLLKDTKESYNNKDLVHIMTTYYGDTTTIACDYYKTKSSNKSIGIYKSYYKNGKLELTINEDKGTWAPADSTEYPNYAVLNTMKLKGDSIIRSFYGDYFFKKYITWNISSSYYFDSAYTSEPSFSIEWLRDGTKNKYTSATEFYISYNINYEDQLFENGIRIIIDTNGKLLPGHAWNMYWTIYNCGLENVNKSSDLLLITTSEALVLAKQQGLIIKDTTKVHCFLEWKTTKEEEDKILNGRFVFSVKQLIPVTKKEHQPEDKGHYIKWQFDPWTKKFIEKKEEDIPPFDKIFGS